ncbi:30S ribosomal protein S6 [Nostoc sp. NIES-3756]|uniref:30S ribosomal protein S6 n=1 Tax=Nostoc sp. NIES-3756 TaxID=1751286 RepID=UPI0007230BF2|nr:30S ribosomal protein S6 [Nostoc sp. NIES-3756]BAT56041.1 30S ribosomal protein S6 [Nostoc sp. NIES-3756]BAY36191.1 30S ribosomal protein S6 [Nostoc sp. NIES-2111]
MSTVYETLYILRPDLTDEQVDQAIAKYQTILQDQGATDLEIQNRGKRRLAYEIKKQRDGVYVQFNYNAPGNAIAPLERAMRLSEEVIRYLTVKQEVTEEKEDKVAVTA